MSINITILLYERDIIKDSMHFMVYTLQGIYVV